MKSIPLVAVGAAIIVLLNAPDLGQRFTDFLLGVIVGIGSLGYVIAVQSHRWTIRQSGWQMRRAGRHRLIHGTWSKK